MFNTNCLLFLIIILFTNCAQKRTNINDVGSGVFFCEEANDTLSYHVDPNRPNIKYCLLDNQKASVLEEDIVSTEPFDTIDIEIYYDSEDFNIQGMEDTLNILLSKTRFGCQIKLHEPLFSLNLESIVTKGQVNTNNIKDDLINNGIFKDEFKFHVYLFEQSDFFNTANAITLKSNDHRIIMGDKDLLKTEMLFLHELGHAFGLTHNNEVYGSCFRNPEKQSLYNVMHESNIGCSRIFTYRQGLITTHGNWSPPIKGDTGDVFDLCSCSTEPNQEKKLYEDYVNSFDKNIDDTPAEDNLVELENYFINEIIPNTLNDTLIERLNTNYGNEFDYYFDSNDLIARTKYISKRKLTHKKLRRNNLLRWLNHERKKTALQVYNISDLSKAESDPLYNYFIETYNIRSNDIIAQLEKHNPIIQFEPRPNCESCKLENDWIKPSEVTYNMCWQYVGESLCINNPEPPRPEQIAIAIDRILRQESPQRDRLVKKLDNELTDSEIIDLIKSRSKKTTDKEFSNKVANALVN